MAMTWIKIFGGINWAIWWRIDFEVKGKSRCSRWPHLTGSVRSQTGSPATVGIQLGNTESEIAYSRSK